MEYDFIIAGGGSAGCVLASRLSADPNNRVLLIEAGHPDDDKYIHIPATFFKVAERGRDLLMYQSEPEKGLHGQPLMVPQGHTLGGGSSVNAMVYIRGNRMDYDTWAQMGCRAWSYEKVLPVFRAQENNLRLSGEYHGAEGELHVNDRMFGHPLSWAFIRAAQEAGIPYNEDFNGAKQEGVGYFQTTTHRGRRWSAAQAFLRHAENRTNLVVRTRTRVARVLLEGRRAVGVELENGQKIRAGREVILTAGALATPKILMLSGIGPGTHLQEHGIGVAVDLPGVGENYQDHLKATVQAEIKSPMSLVGQDKGLRAVAHMAQYLLTKTGLLTSTIVESGGFIDTAGSGAPDVQFHVLPTFVGFDGAPPHPGHGIALEPCILRPQSRGKVSLRSPRPEDMPKLVANALSAEADVETLVRGVELGIKILRQPSLARLVKQRVFPAPGLENDRQGLRDYVRKIAKTVFHPSGTCKMGPQDDSMAVVSEDLKVRGVEGLRVADASIMPRLVSGNTNAPTMMIAERASRFILGEESLTTSGVS